MALKALTCILMAFSSTIAFASITRYESPDPYSPVQMVTFYTEGMITRASFIGAELSLDESGQVSFSDELSINWLAGSAEGLFSYFNFPGEESSLLTILSGDQKPKIEFVVIWGFSNRTLKFEVRQNGQAIVSGNLNRVDGDRPTDAMKSRIAQRIRPDNPKPDDPNDCRRVLGDDCSKFEQLVAERQKEVQLKEDPFSILDPAWRLPTFGKEPESPVNTGKTPSGEPLPYVKLNKETDFPSLVKLATIRCIETPCPSFSGLLLGLGQDKKAYQCTANYWHEGGWFSTSAHCIPEDLRKPSRDKSCAGRIFVKMPDTEKASAVTVECDQIEFVSNYTGKEAGLEQDMAYFRVKQPAQLGDRSPVEIDFGLNEVSIGTSVTVMAVNPVPETPGLNGILQKKTCTVSDPYNIRDLFPARARAGYPILSYQDCNVPTIGGNSGAIVVVTANGKGVAIHQSTTSKSVKFHSATAARCYAPVNLGESIKLGQYSDCEPLTFDQIENGRLRAELLKLQTDYQEKTGTLDKTQQRLELQNRENENLLADIGRLKEILKFAEEKEQKARRNYVEQSSADKRYIEILRIEREASELMSAKSQGLFSIRYVSRGLFFPCLNHPDQWISRFMVSDWLFWTAVPDQVEIEAEFPNTDYTSLARFSESTDVRDLFERKTHWLKGRAIVRQLRNKLDSQIVSNDFEALYYDAKDKLWYGMKLCSSYKSWDYR